MKANKIMLDQIQMKRNCKCDYYKSRSGRKYITYTCKFHRMSNVKEVESKTPILKKITDQMVNLSKVPIIDLSKTQVID